MLRNAWNRRLPRRVLNREMANKLLYWATGCFGSIECAVWGLKKFKHSKLTWSNDNCNKNTYFQFWVEIIDCMTLAWPVALARPPFKGWCCPTRQASDVLMDSLIFSATPGIAITGVVSRQKLCWRTCTWRYFLDGTAVNETAWRQNGISGGKMCDVQSHTSTDACMPCAMPNWRQTCEAALGQSPATDTSNLTKMADSSVDTQQTTYRLICILLDYECDLAVLEVQFLNLLPEEKSYLFSPVKH